jgi:hypothetical protein
MFVSADVSNVTDSMRSLSQFENDAAVASIDLLDSVIYNLAPSSFFKYAPVKTWLYIVCAALYLLKVVHSLIVPLLYNRTTKASR